MKIEMLYKKGFLGMCSKIVCLSILTMTATFFYASQGEAGGAAVIIRVPDSKNAVSIASAAESAASVAKAVVSRVFSEQISSSNSNSRIIFLRSDVLSSEEMVERLKKSPDVIGAAPDIVLRVPDVPGVYKRPILPSAENVNNTNALEGFSFPASSAGVTWGLNALKVPEAWEKASGSKKVYVVVMDTGIDDQHPALKDNIGRDLDGNIGINVVDSTTGTKDFHGHGTHVAGTIGGIGGIGINKRVSLLAVKVIGEEDGTGEGLLSGIEYILDQRLRGLNIKAVNCSFGAWYGSTFKEEISPYAAALRALSDAGVVIVAASGNNGQDLGSPEGEFEGKSHIPASFKTVPSLITVAAVAPGYVFGAFSNKSPEYVHVAAPGVEVSSSIPGGGYDIWWGTSMATPHVTGLVALIASRYENLGSMALRKAILDNAHPIKGLEEFVSTGAVPDAEASVTKGAGSAPVSGVRFRRTKEETLSGNTLRILFDIFPDNARETSMTWTSSNKAVATVDSDGVVTAMDKGKAVIYGRTSEGFEARCVVLVDGAEDVPDEENGGGGCSVHGGYETGYAVFLLFVPLLSSLIK